MNNGMLKAALCAVLYSGALHASSQQISQSESLATDFYRPIPNPPMVGLPNSISAGYWNENLELPGTGYRGLANSSLSRSQLRHYGNGDVKQMRSSWSAGTSQNWYATEGPLYKSSSLLLAATDDLQLKPSDTGLATNDETFLNHAKVTGVPSQNNGTARLISIDGVPVSVPEPGSLAMFGLGLLAAGWSVRRKLSARS